MSIEEKKETARLEAFSDGVFAIAITLLILEIKVPKVESLTTNHELAHALIEQWPSYLSYILSFATILIMWVHHHRLISYIKKSDAPFMYLNGLLLMFITWIPFPTALLAEHMQYSHVKTAVLVYCGSYVIIAICFNLLWRYAVRNRRLLLSRVRQQTIDRVSKQYLMGPVGYLLACVLVLWNPMASIGLFFLIATFFAIATPPVED